MRRGQSIDGRVLVSAAFIIVGRIGLFVTVLMWLGHAMGLGIPFDKRGYIVATCSVSIAMAGLWLLGGPSAIWQLLLQTAAAATLIWGAALIVFSIPSNVEHMVMGAILLLVALSCITGLKLLKKRVRPIRRTQAGDPLNPSAAKSRQSTNG